MKKIVHLCLAFSLMAIVSCKDDQKAKVSETANEEVKTESTATSETKDKVTGKDMKLTVTLSPKSDSNVEGTVIFSQKEGIVTMIGRFTGLSEGTHAIHLHEKADCTSPDGKSSGGHWNPTGQPHGTWGDPAGFHKGDIGNFEADAKGEGQISMNTDQWCIGCGDPARDILGKAIIVHQGADDLKSQPSGAAGARVSCGGIIE